MRTVQVIVLQRAAIARLVKAINVTKDYRTIAAFCLGRLGSVGQAWLSFVRPNGTVVHAYEKGPGDCGGLAVNGVRWLVDAGAVWTQIQALTGR